MEGGCSGQLKLGATVLSHQEVEEKESLSLVTSHLVCLLFTNPHQLTEKPEQFASQTFTRSSSCLENTAENKCREISTSESDEGRDRENVF